jgi:hypothetical protein
MPNFLCTGRDGVIRAFRYVYDLDLDGNHNFLVYSIPPPANGAAYEAAFAPLDAQTVRQIAMHHHGHANYSEKGIPDALLPIVAAKLGLTVVSSPSFQAGGGVFRTPDATKVWNRLVARGIAMFDQATDVFTLL